MSTAILPVYGAFVTALRSDPVVSSLVNGVYDSVPPNVPRPYVTIGAVSETEADAHNATGRDVLVPVHIWSEYAGTKEAAEVLSAVIDVLDRQPMNVPGWTNTSVALQNAVSMTDPDPEIRHINATFRVWLTKE